VAGWSIKARAPRGDHSSRTVTTDPDVLAAHVEDAAHFPGGYAAGLVTVAEEADVAWALHNSSTVLPIGAQSSLTGGATPRGELLLSTAHLNRILDIGADSVRVQPGVSIAELDAALEAVGAYYPPAPTFTGAFVGGTVSTNAAGAATFKYGTTRDWVLAVTVVLPSGEVLDLRRGDVVAEPGRGFEIELRDRTIRVPTPTYVMPRVPKCSAGYFSQAAMDLVDLFVGAEGTLGVITEVELRVLSTRPATCLAFVPFRRADDALRFTQRMRESARETWRRRDASGLDVSAIEHMDHRSLALLREDGVDRAVGVSWPDETAIAILVTMELPPRTTGESVFDDMAGALDASAPPSPILSFCRLLSAFGVLDDVAVAVPGDRRRTNQLLQLREAVPAAVNQRIGRAQRTIDARIEKTAADMIVPFERVEELLGVYADVFSRRGLDVATWGHISDGNLHPNVIARSFADVQSGKDAILECGREAIRLGGSPLAEHGVGRNPIKQQLLIELYGAKGVDEMRRVKEAIDPEWKLAPGVLFPCL
jgi:D-lactate dehydrogenase (cytochrome)